MGAAGACKRGCLCHYARGVGDGSVGNPRGVYGVVGMLRMACAYGYTWPSALKVSGEPGVAVLKSKSSWTSLHSLPSGSVRLSGMAVPTSAT